MRYAALSILLGCSSGSAGPSAPDGGGGDTGVPLVAHVQFVVRGVVVEDGARQLFGEPTSVRITNLHPHDKVTIDAIQKERDIAFASSATFEADEVGTVDTQTQTARDGTYEGVDVDGLFWSSVQTDPKPDFEFNAFHVEVSRDGAPIGSATLGRDFSPPGAMRLPVSDNGLVGVFYAPSDGKKHPAILAFGGSEGGLSGGETYAAYWAARGYAALGVAYFGAPGVPQQLEKIPLEYFDKAMSWLDQRPEADTSKLAVMGGSRGGELALLLGATFPRITTVIAEVPSGVSWGAPVGFSEVASWTKNGTDIPFVPFTGQPTYVKDTDGKTLMKETPAFEKSLDAAMPDVLDAATFKIEATNGKVLLLAGADDQLWPSCRLAKIAFDRLVKAGHDVAHGDRSLCLENAGHAGTYFPGLSTIGSHRIKDPYSSGYLLLGGTAAGNAHASRTADEATRAMLAGM